MHRKAKENRSKGRSSLELVAFGLIAAMIAVAAVPLISVLIR